MLWFKWIIRLLVKFVVDIVASHMLHSLCGSRLILVIIGFSGKLFKWSNCWPWYLCRVLIVLRSACKYWLIRLYCIVSSLLTVWISSLFCNNFCNNFLFDWRIKEKNINKRSFCKLITKLVYQIIRWKIIR